MATLPRRCVRRSSGICAVADAAMRSTTAHERCLSLREMSRSSRFLMDLGTGCTALSIRCLQTLSHTNWPKRSLRAEPQGQTPMNSNGRHGLAITILAHTLLRIASSASGVLLGIYLANLSGHGFSVDAGLLGLLGADRGAVCGAAGLRTPTKAGLTRAKRPHCAILAAHAVVV